MVYVNNGIGRHYLDGERNSAGACVGYAHLEPMDTIDPGENMEAFSYTWLHLPSGKTGTNRVACLDRADFLNYLAYWNTVHPDAWSYTAADGR